MQAMRAIKSQLLGAQDAPRSLLARLPSEIIIRIIDLLQETSPESVDCVASLSPYLEKVARYAKNRHLAVHLTKVDGGKALEAVTRHGLQRAVRRLEVCSGRHRDCWRDDVLSPLQSLLPELTGLRDLHWDNVDIPEAVIDLLKSRPRTRLHLDIFYKHLRGDPKSRQLGDRLMGSPNLESLRVRVSYLNTPSCADITSSLRVIVSTCPNLRNLQIHIAKSTDGCLVFPRDTGYVGLGLYKDERPPPLRELEVTAYPWGSGSEDLSQQGPSSLRYPCKGLEIHHWANTFDWSYLCRLREVYPDIASQISSNLTALKHIKFEKCRQDNNGCMVSFFKTVPTMLESISIPRLACAGLAGILRHGESLQRLKVHQHESVTWIQELPTTVDLFALRDGLPHLRKLGVDIDRNGEQWPHDKLDILASFPKLRELELWFPLDISESRKPMKPYLTRSSAAELYAYLREKSPRQPTMLNRFHVFSGCPAPRSGGMSSGCPRWPSGNSTSFVCQIAERDDKAAAGQFTVTCPKLNKELNETLERAANGKWMWSFPKRHKVAFKVALDGPMSVDDWSSLTYDEVAVLNDERDTAPWSF
ncbi:hypothetical protein HJFPF1_12185 [Paramyrothecium foliicola]|nr:hypothetical protein HJFPF1_12185 [Paramyrothecium foliicola]